MKKNLLLFSGLGTPNHKRFITLYKVIHDEAKRRKYNEIVQTIWPGHAIYHRKAVLNLSIAVELGKQYVEKMEEKAVPYDFIACSFGIPAALLVVKQFTQLPYLQKIKLWGVVPYWLTYRAFKRDINETIAFVKSDRNTDIDPDFFAHFVPVELLLTEYELNKPLTVATGDTDKSCHPSFLEYLRNIVDNPCITFRLVKNAKHGVFAENKDYFDMLFG